MACRLLAIGPLGTIFSEILSEINTFSFKKMRFKTPSAKWWPFCLGLNVLMCAPVDNEWDADIWDIPYHWLALPEVLSYAIYKATLWANKLIITQLKRVTSCNIVYYIINSNIYINNLAHSAWKYKDPISHSVSRLRMQIYNAFKNITWLS